jgi:hypothetical protein
MKGNEECFKKIMLVSEEKNENLINIRDNNYNTPLLTGFIHGNKECIEFLLLQNINLNAINSYKQNFFHLTALYETTHCLLLMEEMKFEKKIVNDYDIFDKTALHYATEKGNFEVVKMIITKYGGNIDVQDGNGNTALHIAILNKNEKIKKVLMENQANENLKNNNNLTSKIYLDNEKISFEKSMIKTIVKENEWIFNIYKKHFEKEKKNPLLFIQALYTKFLDFLENKCTINDHNELVSLIEQTTELQTLSLKELNQSEENLCFFLNVYNMLIVHATLLLEEGSPKTSIEFQSYLNMCSYDIGGELYSLRLMKLKIENLFNSIEKESMAITPLMGSIFSYNYEKKMEVYKVENLINELKKECQKFLQENIKIKKDEIEIPWIVKEMVLIYSKENDVEYKNRVIKIFSKNEIENENTEYKINIEKEEKIKEKIKIKKINELKIEEGQYKNRRKSISELVIGIFKKDENKQNNLFKKTQKVNLKVNNEFTFKKKETNEETNKILKEIIITNENKIEIEKEDRRKSILKPKINKRISNNPMIDDLKNSLKSEYLILERNKLKQNKILKDLLFDFIKDLISNDDIDIWNNDSVFFKFDIFNFNLFQ